MRKIKSRHIKRITAGTLAAVLGLSLMGQYYAGTELVMKGYGENNSASNNYLVEHSEFIKSPMFWQIQKAMATSMGRAKTFEELYQAADVQIAKGKYEDALGSLEACIQVYKGNDQGLSGELQLKTGCLNALLGDYDAAMEHLKLAEQHSPDTADIYLVRAQIYSQQEEPVLAFEELKRYLEKNPLDAPVQLAVGELYLAQGDMQNALQCFNTVVENGGQEAEDPQLYRKRAGVYLLTGQADEAEEDIETYIQMAGESDAQAEFMAGLAHMMEAGYEEAVERFQAAVDLGYEQPELCLEQMVQCYFQLGDYSQVLEKGKMAKKEPEKVSQYELLNRQMGIAAMALNRPGEAAVCFTESMKGTDGAGDVYYRGICYMAQEQYSKAAADFTRSIQNGQWLEESRYNRAVCRLQLENYEAAETDFRWVAGNGGDGESVEASRQVLAAMEEAKNQTLLAVAAPSIEDQYPVHVVAAAEDTVRPLITNPEDTYGPGVISPSTVKQAEPIQETEEVGPGIVNEEGQDG